MSIMAVTGRAAAQLGPAFDYSFARRAQPNAGDFNRRWDDINRRLGIQEAFIPSYDGALAAFLQDTLTRVDDFLRPAYDQIVAIGQLGALFTATSATSVAVGLGVKTFMLPPGIRDQFAAAAYIGVQSVDDPDTLLFGPLQSYDRGTGTLVVGIQQFTGAVSGSLFANWRISAAGTPNFLATAHGVGTYTQAEIDGFIAAVVASAAGCVSKAGDTMSGALTVAGTVTVKGTYPSSVLDYTGIVRLGTQVGPDKGYSLYDFANAYKIFGFGYDGGFYTAQLGDLKTYVDKGVRTDVAQAFTAAMRKLAKQNIGSLGTGYGYIGLNTTLTTADMGRTMLVQAGVTVTLPASTVVGDGALIYLRGWNGSSTIRLSGTETFLYDNGANPAQITLRKNQGLFLENTGGDWLVLGYDAPWGDTPSVNTAQAFNDAQKQQFLANADIAIPVGQCRLNYISPTQIRLDPFNGNRLFINGNYRTIPAAGIALSNAGLNANTLYYVYAYWSAGTIALQTVAAGSAGNAAPIVSPTYGNKIAGNGDNNFALVGMVYMDTAGKFYEDDGTKYVASFFNRRRRLIASVVTTNGSTGSGSWVVLGNSRLGLFWGDEIAKASIVGSVYGSAAGVLSQTINQIDGAVGGFAAANTHYSTNAFMNICNTWEGVLSEGLHTFSAAGQVSGGTAAWQITQYVETMI